MEKVSFSDGIGIVGIIFALVLLALDKAGRLKGGWLFVLLFVAAMMTLFIAVGNSWVLDSPHKWKLWRGALMVCLVGFTYSGLSIWISNGAEPESKNSPEAKTERHEDTNKPKGTQKPQEAKPAPPRIQTAAPYGNLAERCDSMGTAIRNFVQDRIKIQPATSERTAYAEWYRLNDGQFRWHFWDDIAKLQKDLSDVRVVDPPLDKLLTQAQRDFDYRQQHVDEAMKFPEACHLSVDQIEKISARFKYLATEIPQH